MGKVLKARPPKTGLEERLKLSEERFRHLAALSSDWYWEQDDQFRLTFMSKDMAAKTGLNASAYLGVKRWDRPALNLTEADWARHRAQLERHEPFRDFEMQREAPGGRSVWLSLSGEPVFDDRGTFTGYRGIGRDITEQKAAETALRTSEARFRSLTELSSDWYWEQDAELRFTKFEGSGPVGARYSPATAILGRLAWEIPGLVEGSLDDGAHRTRLERRESFRGLEYSYRDHAGRQYFISISGEPVFDKGGRFVGYRGTSRDITERKRREGELARFRAAMDASPDMIYVTDRETMRFLYLNEAACRLTGFTPEEFLNIGPADLLRVPREQVEREFDDAIAAGAEGTVQELKSTTKAGLRTMVEVRRRAVKLEGRWIVFTISHDISERKRAEQALVRSGRMFAALSATNEAIMRSSSPEELYRRVCEAAVEGGKVLTTAVLVVESGVARMAAASGVVPKALREMRIPLEGDEAAARGLTGTAFRSGASRVSNDLLRDEGARAWHDAARESGVAAAAAIPFTKEGKVLGVLLFFSDEKHAFDGEIVKLLERMAENVVFALDNLANERQRSLAEERIQYLATHDALTGLPNRVMFSQLLNHAIDSALRYKRAFALLFIDLDRFKAINDTLGHQAGDQLLQAVAGRLRKTVRASDVVARLSGDEFVVLVQETSEAAQAEAVARKIIVSLGAPLQLGDKDCSVTASIGIALCPGDASDERTLMKNADRAMYLAKEQGRAGFRLYQAEPGAT